MSVILQIGNFGVAQGWSSRAYVGVANSGDENIKGVFLKVIDTVVFDKLEAVSIASPDYSVLNVYPTSKLKFYDTSSGGSTGEAIPASSTKWLNFDITVKAGAPIQVNNLVCYWQYITY